jgi:hypothetical protein
MHRLSVYISAGVLAALLSGAAGVARAEVAETEQQTLRTQYVGKVLLFRTCYRMANHLEVAEDGAVKGSNRPGVWSVDGAVQVKDMEFGKDRVTLKCTKLWADIKDDGQLHYFPVSAALKGKADYPENADVVFRTKKDAESAEEVRQRVRRVFLGEQESVLSAAPQPIAAYIQKLSLQVDVDPISGMGFTGTLPKARSRVDPDLTREAELVGQTGRESFVVFVDEHGSPAVVSFTHLLQYGLEEATIEAVKKWKFEPALKDGKAVAIRIPMFIDYKRPNKPR